jgi:hypothetical protein
MNNSYKALFVSLASIKVLDSVKLKMFERGMSIIDTGKTEQDAFNFVKTLLDDGHYAEEVKDRVEVGSETPVKHLTEEDLVSFGNYLLSEKRKESFTDTEKDLSLPSIEERLKLVNDVDLANWKHFVATKTSVEETTLNGKEEEHKKDVPANTE